MMCYTVDMKRKFLFTAIMFIMMITALFPLTGEEVPFRKGMSGVFGFDEPGNNSITTGYSQNSWIPWLEELGCAGKSQRQVLKILQDTDILYTAITYEKDVAQLYPSSFEPIKVFQKASAVPGIVIYGFLKDNPLYYLTVIYSPDGKFMKSGIGLYENYDLFLDKYGRKTMEDVWDDQWDRLSDDARYACAFSSNLISANGHSLYTFKIYDSNDNMISTLESGWDCHNIQDVLDEIETLSTGGHHGSYNKMKAMLEDNPDKSVMDIARDYMLDNRDIMRLYFVQEMKDRLGEHGIEAWDDGRSICLLRWAAEAGWISQEEAFERTKPITARIRNSYSSWEDFMAHYIAGRGFFTLTDLNVESMQNSAFGFVEEFRNDDKFSTLPMLSEADNPNPILKLEDAFYTANAEAQRWNECWDYFNTEPDNVRQLLIGQLWLSFYPDIPCVYMFNLRNYFALGKYSQSLPLFRKAAHCFQVPDSPELMEAGTLYDEFWYDWMILANNDRKSEEAKVAAAMVMRTDNLDIVSYNLGLSYLHQIGTAPTQEKNDFYREKAAEYMAQAVEEGYDVPENILAYLGITE